MSPASRRALREPWNYSSRCAPSGHEAGLNDAAGPVASSGNRTTEPGSVGRVGAANGALAATVGRTGQRDGVLAREAVYLLARGRGDGPCAAAVRTAG